MVLITRPITSTPNPAPDPQVVVRRQAYKIDRKVHGRVVRLRWSLYKVLQKGYLVQEALEKISDAVQFAQRNKSHLGHALESVEKFNCVLTVNVWKVHPEELLGDKRYELREMGLGHSLIGYAVLKLEYIGKMCIKAGICLKPVLDATKAQYIAPF
ncbi:hypothetical protein CALCODRAFT_505337 [Calocera cornea HHB12733]|uniref:Uncharacterized protein n=1 Tax=Calocera cornea HHB12733 TaxID=1353952 RepID=A0A165KCM9_9BASI|nr:hypothetical protein CALCODRAFT_505337 [Calocera cornea HHB12733]